jgi:hypothetical protein
LVFFSIVEEPIIISQKSHKIEDAQQTYKDFYTKDELLYKDKIEEAEELIHSVCYIL